MEESPRHTKKFFRLPDEGTLVRQVSEGDEQAYRKLYTHYYPHLYTSLVFISKSHEDTQEIIHEVFLKIWKTRESLAMIRSFEDYAYVMAKNLLLNLLKRKKLGEKILSTAAEREPGTRIPTPDEEFLFKQYYQLALSAIDRLPPQQKRVFLLRTREGLSLEEIAALMHISRSTVKKHLYQAMKFVKDYLRESGIDLPLVILFFIKIL